MYYAYHIAYTTVIIILIIILILVIILTIIIIRRRRRRRRRRIHQFQFSRAPCPLNICSKHLTNY